MTKQSQQAHKAIMAAELVYSRADSEVVSATTQLKMTTPDGKHKLARHPLT